MVVWGLTLCVRYYYYNETKSKNCWTSGRTEHIQELDPINDSRTEELSLTNGLEHERMLAFLWKLRPKSTRLGRKQSIFYRNHLFGCSIAADWLRTFEQSWGEGYGASDTVSCGISNKGGRSMTMFVNLWRPPWKTLSRTWQSRFAIVSVRIEKWWNFRRDD